MKNIVIILGLILLQSSAFAIDEAMIEQKKEFKYSFSAQSTDVLDISNHYGDIKVVFWNKDAVQTNVTVTANAPNSSMLEELFGSINISGKKVGSQIRICTLIDKSSSFSSWSSKSKGKPTNFRIDYLIYMPADLELKLSNSFGEVILPDFKAPLSLNLNYCTLVADNIQNRQSSLNLNYGSADIGTISGGNINSNFMNINISEAKNMILNNNHGRINVKTMEDLEGILNYSKGLLGNIKDEVKLKLNFSNNLIIKNIDEHINNLEISSNYSDLDLPISNKFNGSFDIRTTHGTFLINPALSVIFYRNSEKDKKTSTGRSTSNFYQGKIGTNIQKGKIVIISNYGDVKIK